jgi:hypothetical protein
MSSFEYESDDYEINYDGGGKTVTLLVTQVNQMIIKEEYWWRVMLWSQGTRSLWMLLK